jgi:3-phosphoinositide dependent protein kinase-1
MDKRHTFEDPKPHSAANQNSQVDQNSTALSAQDWLDTISRAKDIALSQSATNAAAGGYSYSAGDDAYNLASSGLSSHANTLDAASEMHSSRPEDNAGDGLGSRGGERVERGNMRATLQKHHSSDRALRSDGDGDSVKGTGREGRSKRFSKRQSKGVLAAVF